jgi:hypothetical protein
MTAQPNLSLANLQLIAALAEAQDAGAAAPAWKDIAARLGKDNSNLRKTGLHLAKLGVITLDPLDVPADTRALAAAFLPGSGAHPAAPADGKGDRPPARPRGAAPPGGGGGRTPRRRGGPPRGAAAPPPRPRARASPATRPPARIRSSASPSTTFRLAVARIAACIAWR